VTEDQRADLLDRAIEESQTAIQLGGDQLEVLRARGLVLYFTGNHEEAIEAFKAAIAINKNIYDLHLYLGLAYRASEQYGLAQEALLSAVGINSKDPDAYTELSRAYYAGGTYAPAAQYAEEAIKVDPANPRLHGNLGFILYRMGEFARAIPELSLAIRGGVTGDGVTVEGLPLDYDQRIMEYYVYYGFSLMKSGRCAEAVPIFNALLSGVPNDETTIYNANFGIATCDNGGATPTPEPETGDSGDEG
jgi:tetratricopeptide (TPR) repeat protein